MSKLYIVFIVLIVISSCKHAVTSNTKSIKNNNNNDTITAFKKSTFKATFNDALLARYSSYLITLDTTDWESSTIAARKYTTLFLDADLNTRDSAFIIFNKFYAKLDNSLSDLHDKDTTINYDSLITDQNHRVLNLSAKLVLYHEKLTNNGFKVYMSEGDTYIGEDLDFIAKWFYSYVSAPVKQSLIQLNKEDKEGFEEDAGLTIGPKQLVDRAVWWEKFAEEYPNTIITNEAQNIWQNYTGTLMEGMDNSPVIETGGTTLDVYYKTAYKYLQSSYPDAKTNSIVNPFFKLMLNKQTKKADALLKEYQRKGIII
jgi:hypothetical protein